MWNAPSATCAKATKRSASARATAPRSPRSRFPRARCWHAHGLRWSCPRDSDPTVDARFQRVPLPGTPLTRQPSRAYCGRVDATYRGDLRELNELNFSRFDAKLEQRLAEFDAKLERRIGE